LPAAWRGEHQYSQIFGYFLELIDSTALLARQCPRNILEAMIEVVLDQRLFCLANRLFDRMKLLRDLQARSTTLDHFDHTAQVACNSIESFDDLRVSLVRLPFCHNHSYPRGMDIVKARAPFAIL
jgi:hypothetical protein